MHSLSETPIYLSKQGKIATNSLILFISNLTWLFFLTFRHQAPVVQTLDSAIHRINHYPADKYYANQLRYPLDSDLSGG